MKPAKVLIPIFLFLFISCSKTSNQSSGNANGGSPFAGSAIEGTWTVETQISSAWPYPWPQNYVPFNYAFSYSSALQYSTIANDTFAIKFDDKGVYTFTQPLGGYSFLGGDVIVYTPYSIYQRTGNYKPVNDSEIVILPDTSSLLKLCYQSADTDPSFVMSDTIHFTINRADSLTITQRWTGPNTYDTLTANCIYQTSTGFRKL
jgi:hypothetical protein